MSPAEPEPERRVVPPGLAGLGAGAAGAGAAPRDAATVILLRPTARGGYETFLVKRAREIAFMGGAHVFPGGRVDPRTDPNVEAAAVREVEEESGVKLDVRSLRLFARWVTPEVEPRRYDARFFLAPVPAGQAAEADRSEVTEGEWISPRAALAAAEAGRIHLPPPTLWNLMDLAAIETIEAALAEAARRAASGIEPVMPVPSIVDGRIRLSHPGGRFDLVDGRWRAFRA